ncbi:MAG: hypothetical protein LBN34_07620 [Clostridiales Family XIII bacterium]|jgi:hypothetical protein|nr:hypothetical protein [Clostridiales Family XIII bacterium]
MAVLKAKKVSYGLVELRDDFKAAQYGIYVNGQLKEYSGNLQYLIGVFDKK